MTQYATSTTTLDGIIGIPGRLGSESASGFDRNRWPQSSESAGELAAIVLMALFGITLLLPRLSERMTRPIVALGARLSQTAGGATFGSSLVLGVATGLLWAPCAGPILGLLLTCQRRHKYASVRRSENASPLMQEGVVRGHLPASRLFVGCGVRSGGHSGSALAALALFELDSAVAVHFKDMDVVGEAIESSSAGEPFGGKHAGPLRRTGRLLVTLVEPRS